VWAIIGIPVRASGEGQSFSECLVGHGKTPWKRQVLFDSAMIDDDDQD